MAKLNSLETVGVGSSGTGDSLFAMLASFGVLICMVSTLMGIKFWWFKQRLTFNHSTTNNGAAGGATPTVPLRTRSSREKRLSQQISEPVEVHGVFRRRQDDDLDIVPTKQLPPVRIRKLSQSTPSLFPQPPPRRQDKVRSAIYEEYEPPTREPPRPPVDLPLSQADSAYSPVGSPQPLTPAISLIEEMPTFDELEQKYRQMELKEKKVNELKAESTESIFRIQNSPPQPPKRLNRNSYNGEQLVGVQKFVKAKYSSTQSERFQQKFADRRATGYMRPEQDDINVILAGADSPPNEIIRSPSVEEFGERRPSGYIKYEEIDVVDDLQDFREKWDRLQTSFKAESPAPYHKSERLDYETLHEPSYDHINRANARNSHTLADGAQAADTEEIRGLGRTEQRLSWEANECMARKRGTPESQDSMEFTSDEDYAEELDGVKRKTVLKSASVADCSDSGYKNGDVARPQSLQQSWTPIRTETIVNTHIEEEGTFAKEPDEQDTFTTVQPTGYVHASQPEQLWEELEANIKQDEREKRLWLEIEKDIDLNQDFVRNIEEEFIKIRHSYEENEAAFLENNGGLKRVPKQVVIITPEPEGFGKSIDEDWESFENLAIEKPIQPVQADKSVVQFNLSDLEDANDSDRELPLRTERRPTDFVPKSTTFKRELSNIEDEDEPTSPLYSESGVEFVEEDRESSATPLKDNRPTVYAHAEISELDDDYVHEHNKESIFEPAEEPLTVTIQSRARPRPRQKVTFDFSSTEYYQASKDDDEEDQEQQEATTNLSTTTKHAYNESDSFDEEATHILPKPTQRITKIHYTAEMHKDRSSPTENQIRRTPSPTISPSSVVPPLFGTQISLETVESNMDDSWTAKRQRGEMIAHSKQTTSQRSMSPTVLNVEELPKPALRNPLAQAATVRSVILMEESVVTHSQIGSFKPHAAVRQQYFEKRYSNSTEA